MKIIFGKITKIIIAVLYFIIQIANMFLANIIVYEVTEGVKFDWILLFKSPGFWIVTVITFIYYSIPFIIKQKDNYIDEALEKALSNSSVKIVNSITYSVQNGDFESCKKSLKILDQIQKRRRK